MARETNINHILILEILRIRKSTSSLCVCNAGRNDDKMEIKPLLQPVETDFATPYDRLLKWSFRRTCPNKRPKFTTLYNIWKRNFTYSQHIYTFQDSLKVLLSTSLLCSNERPLRACMNLIRPIRYKGNAWWFRTMWKILLMCNSREFSHWNQRFRLKLVKTKSVQTASDQTGEKFEL